MALLGYVPAVGGGSDARRASASPWALLERDDLRPVRSRTKTLLWIAEATSGPMLAMMARAVRPLVADGYDVWLASLRPNMPDGYTVADMAEDFAGLITDEFDGRVDLVVGHSTGGLIGFCLAAGHSARFGHVAIAGAGLWNEQSDQANLEFCRLLVAGRRREAGERAVRLLAPDVRLPGLLGTLIAWASLTTASAEDLRTTAEAMHRFDPQEVLPSITVPVLLVAGDQDIYLDHGEIEHAAQLIPRCTLRVYPNTNHFGAITSPRFAGDIREFVRQHE